MNTQQFFTGARTDLVKGLSSATSATSATIAMCALIAGTSLLSATVFASEARVAALQNAVTVANDVQDTFEKPGRLTSIPDMVTLEFGTTGMAYTASSTGYTGTVASAPNAEGGIVRSMGDSKLAFYVGRQSSTFTYLINGGVGKTYSSAVIGTPYSSAEGRRLDNPLSLLYAMKMGDISLGGHLYYAASSKKSGTNNFDKSATGLSLSANTDVWEGYVNAGLGSSVKNTTSGSSETFTGDSSFTVGGFYNLSSMQIFANYGSAGGTLKNAAGNEASKLAISNYTLGVESKVKGDMSHVFYGISYAAVAEEQKTAASAAKVETTALPIIVGLEADAASWLVLRASLTQPILIATQKFTASGTSNTDSMLDKTVIAAGAGLKMNKLLLDMVLSAGTTGVLSTTNFGSQASLTYNF